MTKPAPGGVAGEHVRPRLPLYVAPTSAGSGANALSSPIVPLACWRLEDVRFEFDSSLIKPEAKAEWRCWPRCIAACRRPPPRCSATPIRSAPTSTTRR